MRVWLDDDRPMPPGFTHCCRTAREAIDLLCTGEVTEIDLDYDLGEDSLATGLDVALFIEEGAKYGTLKKMKMGVHSSARICNYLMFRFLTIANQHWARRNNYALNNV